MSSLPDAEITYGHEVYRIFDAAGRLLYVGMGHDAKARIDQHHYVWGSRVQATWLMVGLMSSWCAEPYPNRTEARAAETAAIKAEHPMFNKHHNKGWQLMRDEFFMAYHEGEIGAVERQFTRFDIDPPVLLETAPTPFVRDRDAEQARINAYVKRYDLKPEDPHPFVSPREAVA